MPPASVYSIPAGVSFVDCLAEGLLAQSGGDPLALAATTVLLPNRRAVRALGEAFLRRGEGKPLLLPRLLPLGDVDAEELALAADETLLQGEAALALAPALAPLRRQALLSHLVVGWARSAQITLSGAAVATLAQDLAALLDEAETNEVALAGLRELVPDRYAAHWQTTLAFLALVAEHWPRIEAEQGALSPAARRRQLLALQIESWRRIPPPGPVIAAGSTGSIPAVARLLAAIARLPQGAVVLPGLDEAARAPLWEAIAEDPSHPQHGLGLLLRALEVTPGEVRRWPGAPPAGPRAGLIQLALRPAAMTDSWRDLARAATLDERAAWARSLADLTWIDCPGLREEAATIALLLREALETPGRTAALVTPDRGLARRVRAELGRWGLEIDDSAGTPLERTAPAVFLRLLAGAAAEGFAPVPLLALLKHPLAAGGRQPAAFRQQARRLERCLLRGPRPAAGLEGLEAALLQEKPDAEVKACLAFVRALRPLLRPYLEAIAPAAASPAELLRALLQAGEALAESEDEHGAERLWKGEAGEAAAALFAELLDAGDFPPLAPPDWPALFEVLLQGAVVRPRWGSHPRLFIWGPLEARLQQADRMILGGLNEGTWPAESDPGPWLSRPMRRTLGLPAPERRVGMAAHDLAQALAAPEVVLTRAVKVEGAPTLPSRWLLRLDALLRTLGLQGALARWREEELGWSAALDRPAGPAQPVAPPQPRPPVALRPRRLSVTRIETWMRNPYEIYARHILELDALPPLDQDPAAAERGQLVHSVLEQFAKTFPEGLPPDAGERLRALLDQALDRLRPGQALLWRPRLERLADWFLAAEEARRGELRQVLVELRGELVLEGGFKLSALADRIELRDQGVTLIDYKTGQPPSNPDIASGRAPQLPLEAAILARGGFAGLPAQPVTALEIWHVTGGQVPGSIKPVKGDPAVLAEEAHAGLRALIERFDDPATPYHPWPDATFKPRFDAYALLARVPEWAPGEEEP